MRVLFLVTNGRAGTDAEHPIYTQGRLEEFFDTWGIIGLKMGKDARGGASFSSFSINLNFALRITHYALRDTHYAKRITRYALRDTHYAIRTTLEGDGELALEAVGVEAIAVEVFAVAVIVFDTS